jgi:predicted DNA-binding transcriptional regulator AlpA
VVVEVNEKSSAMRGRNTRIPKNHWTQGRLPMDRRSTMRPELWRWLRRFSEPSNITMDGGIFPMILETLQKRETIMNIHEVACLFGLSESLVYRMAAAGQIPTVRFCAALRFDPSELAAWYENRLHPFAGKIAPASQRPIARRIRIAG